MYRIPEQQSPEGKWNRLSYSGSGFPNRRKNFCKSQNRRGDISRRSACNFCAPETGFCAMGGELLYAFTLEAPEEDPVSKKPSLPGNIEISKLINEQLPDPTSSYYSKVGSTGGGIWGVLSFKAGRGPWGGISANGVLPEDYSRYS